MFDISSVSVMSEMYNQAVANDDTVHTLFFSSLSHSNIEFWENLCKQINLTLNNLSRGYIWHRDEFKVCLPLLKDDCGMPMHLIATTCFGDNIEDEWFIIYLILELSKIFQDLIIQVTDNDGDFLLVEAADYLPSWANPESTENRVFISNNAIHLIPPDVAHLDNKLEIKDALRMIIKYSDRTTVLPEIKNAIFKRIHNYPARIAENIHRVIVRLPLDIATILTLKPSLIAPIVIAYCNHDMIDLRACKNNDKYPDYAYVNVSFTRCLYAMLIHSKLIGSVKSNKTSQGDKKHVLGLKITYGFQMLTKTLIKDIFSTSEFQKFVNNLKLNGYFNNNIEDSKEYNNLLENAKRYFVDMECPISTHTSNEVLEIMGTDEFKKCKESLKEKNNTDVGLTEDNDDWLNIHPSQLTQMLNDRYGNNVNFQDDDLLTPKTITSRLADFLNQSSDFEGIDTENNDSDNGSIHFDADQFVDCLENTMNLVLGDVKPSTDQDSEGDDFDDELDEELATKLKSYEENRSNKNKVMFNLTQSIKNEGLSGPSSNLLSNIGINKTDLLDSDDD